MIFAQTQKIVELLAPATVSTSATTSASVDTLGFNYIEIIARLPAATATNSSAQWGVLQLLEADVTNISSATSIVAFTGTTNTVTSSTAGFVIQPQNNTSYPQIYNFLVTNTGSRKRYLFLEVQGAASHSTTYAAALLSRGEEVPGNDSQRGFNTVSVIG